MRPTLAPLLILGALVGCATEDFTYDLYVRVVVPEDVQAELTYPALVQVEWLDEDTNLALLCEPSDGLIELEHEDSFWHTEHVQHQHVLARVVPVALDGPCDPAADLEGLSGIEGAWPIPWDEATVFPDDADLLGYRTHQQEDAALLVVDYDGSVQEIE